MGIILDFKRETIDREILIQKLNMYVFKGHELEWFKSYLTERRQMTMVNGTKSDELNNEFGVP